MLSYRSCMLCPRRCGVDREASELGFCQMPGQLRAARALAAITLLEVKQYIQRLPGKRFALGKKR